MTAQTTKTKNKHQIKQPQKVKRIISVKSVNMQSTHFSTGGFSFFGPIVELLCNMMNFYISNASKSDINKNKVHMKMECE